MSDDKKKLQDIKYYEESIDEIRKTEEYKDFTAKYKDNKLQRKTRSLDDAYVTNVSYELFRTFENDLSSSDTRFIKDREVLASLGKYLDTLEILREKLTLNNTATSKKDPAFKYKVNNPFFVSYDQLKKEFDITENKKNGECEVCAKNMFWINRTIKTVRGLRFGRQTEYAKSKNMNKKVFRHLLYNTYNSKNIRDNETDIMANYYRYLNDAITYNEFKEDKNFIRLKKAINENMKDNASIKGKIPEIDVNFLMHDLTLSNLLNKLYIGKVFYMEKSISKIKEEGIIKRNKIKAGTFNEKNNTIVSIIIPKYNLPFEVKVDKIYSNRDIDKLDLDFKNEKRGELPSRKNVVYKFTNEQIEKLEDAMDTYSILNKPAQKIVDYSNLMYKGQIKEIINYDTDREDVEKE